MNTFIQANRFLSMESPLKNPWVEACVLDSCTITEALSKPFKIIMKLHSKHLAIAPKDMIGQPVTVQIKVGAHEKPRYFNGIIQTFNAEAAHDGIRTYSASAGPWLSFLDHTSDCRIFNQKKAVDIVKTLFEEWEFFDYETGRLHETYHPLEYCTQYHESTSNFIHRILAEAGIFYFYKHTHDKHILTMADTSYALPPCFLGEVTFDPSETVRDHYIHAWRQKETVYSGKVTHIDYHFEKSRFRLEGKPSDTAQSTLAQRFENYQPGRHRNIDEGNTKAQYQLQANEAAHHQIEGRGTYTCFTPGTSFKCLNAPVEGNAGDYFITEVSHQVVDNRHRAGDNQDSTFYVNSFTCIPRATTFRLAPFHLSRPHIFGAQTATVVGPAGEEIHTDKYGRVQVQFHWMRQNKNHEKTSCWVRVAQAWAGRGFGAFFLPRVGQEVVVQFIDGDPDNPLITAGVYNPEHMPPYELPSDQTKSGIKTHSIKGGSQEGNEIRFDDKKGQEEVYLHAQKDFTSKIENNKSEVLVKGDYTTDVQSGKWTLKAADSIEFQVEDTSIVIAKGKITIDGKEVLVNGG